MAFALTATIPAMAGPGITDTAELPFSSSASQEVLIDQGRTDVIVERFEFEVRQDLEAAAQLDEAEVQRLEAAQDSESVDDVDGGLSTSYLQTPFPSRSDLPISSPFGPRWGRFHMGVDIPLALGEPIYPIANGVITAVFQGNHPGGGGYMVIVEHNIDGQIYESWYAHMQAGSVDVQEGDVVTLDTLVGAVGSTGNSTGPHLHLEVKNPDDISIDPLRWITTREEILPPAGY
ncbi:hypothetical protein GCM10009846_22470 [Agrococcus versicolor]|uniref:M23ase beta-sheet core domain-containing protein n=1 Tax=Agrococcus versicolor TaxID=501482 RepID=A0ABN3AU78_9MICO